jgi:hypothetical protein
MPRINSYPLTSTISNDDLLLLDDKSKGYATKSVKLSTLKSYVATNSASETYVEDQVVTGASFDARTGMLSLTRSSGDMPEVTTNIDGRYYLSSNPNSYTSNRGVIQEISTKGETGEATLIDGVLNIPQYANAKGIEGPQGPRGVAGPKGPEGPTGQTGATGSEGNGIKDVRTDREGTLTITFTNGDEFRTNDLIGAKGREGAAGADGADGATGPTGPAGPEGEIGPQGPKGDDGAEGPRGPAGVDGTDGADGADGTDGNSVTIKGTKATENDLPDTNNTVGDLWIVTGENGDGYVWTASNAWENVGPVQGPKGDKGDTGKTGATGPQGPRGIGGKQGPTGDDGPQGERGARGETGPRGGTGPRGANGAEGPEGPAGPTGPAGPQGPKGETGAKGEQGIEGPEGPRGIQGEDGVPGTPGAQGPQGTDGAAASFEVVPNVRPVLCDSSGNEYNLNYTVQKAIVSYVGDGNQKTNSLYFFSLILDVTKDALSKAFFESDPDVELFVKLAGLTSRITGANSHLNHKCNVAVNLTGNIAINKPMVVSTTGQYASVTGNFILIQPRCTQLVNVGTTSSGTAGRGVAVTEITGAVGSGESPPVGVVPLVGSTTEAVTVTYPSITQSVALSTVHVDAKNSTPRFELKIEGSFIGTTVPTT